MNRAERLLCAAIVCVQTAFAGPGDPDLTFAPNADNVIQELKSEANGGVLIRGDFSLIGGLARNGFARLDANGAIDPNFTVQFGGGLGGLSPLPDGKIVAAGSFASINGAARVGLARLNADGTVDASFDLQWHGGSLPNGGPPLPPGTAAFSCQILAVLGNGDLILRTRNLYNANGSIVPSLTKISSAGVATAFSFAVTYVDHVWPLQNGKLLASYYTDNNVQIIARCNADGSLDSTFTPFKANLVLQALEMADGKIVLLGWPVSRDPVGSVGRLNEDGSLDLSFKASIAGRVGSGYSEPDGSLVISGYFVANGDTNVLTVARLRASGELDPGFRPATGGEWSVYQVARDGKGRAVVGGEGRVVNLQWVDTLRRLEGDNPASAGSFVFTSTRFEGQEGRKAKIGVERASSQNGAASVDVVLTAASAHAADDFDAGTIHLDFAPGEKSKIAEIAIADDATVEPIEFFYADLKNPSATAELGWQSRAKVQVIDDDGPASVVADFAFSPIGYSDVRDFCILEDGSMIVVGDFTRVQGELRPGIAKLHRDGSLDSTFVPSIPQWIDLDPFRVEAVLPLPNGKILVSGVFPRPERIYHTAVYKLNADGSVDSVVGSVDQNGVHLAMAMQGSKLLVFGGFGEFNGVPANGAVRINEDGSIDPTFSAQRQSYVSRIGILSNGDILVVGGAVRRVTANGQAVFEKTFGAEDFVELPDGKILLAGSFNNQTQAMIRLNADGGIDATFVPDFSAFPSPLQATALAIQGNGKAVMGIKQSNRDDGYLVRVLASGQVDMTFEPIHFTGSYLGYKVIERIALDADGSILTGGLFAEVNEVSRPCLARFKGGEEAADRPLLMRSIEAATQTSAAVTLSVPPLKKFVVERSIDLQSWAPISTNISIDARFDFTNTSANASDKVFYRTKLAP